MNQTDFDPRSLALDDLRELRAHLQEEDDAVSFVRRLVQARLDVARAELRHRAAGEHDANITDELPAILGSQLTGGPARPPRPAEDFSDHPLARELEELCSEFGSTDLPSMSLDELGSYVTCLHDFERERSAERKELFGRIDALSAELVRRYRDGEAAVDGMMVADADSDSDS